ncbi:unnamed protein product [Hapterophycus canaliculatus]
MAATVVKNVKRRPRRHQHQCHTRAKVGAGISIVDVHDIAYWSQWRVAIHEVCARFEGVAQVETEERSTEGLDYAGIPVQQACCRAFRREVRHLETQLGKHTSMNAKLEAALCENAEALKKAESARVAAVASVSRLQAQISCDKETASARAEDLENKISLSAAARHSLEESLRQAESAKLQADAKGAELLLRSAKAEAEVRQARSALDRAVDESRVEKERREALQADLAALREKYSALKRRFVDAGRKVEAVRVERDALRQERATLQDQLADVEKFQSSRRGQALVRMEQDLARERMARVELEADRDDLESQLAAALQVPTSQS